MDARVEQIFYDRMRNDKSFTEKSSPLELIFGRNTYSQAQVRDIYYRGIRTGIELGLQEASLPGQEVQLRRSAQTELQKAFLDEFYRLAAKYEFCITYHPRYGMVVREIATRDKKIMKMSDIKFMGYGEKKS